ncbi:MAG: aldo/keto reductase [Anaerolineales bacterium]
MEYRNLGKAGVKVSAIGIGCNQFGGKVDKAGTKAIVQRALDEGINFFDTANVYSKGVSEEFVGAALKGERERVVIATKVRFKMGEGPNDVGASRYHILNAVEASLRRLGTEHIDLYQIHAWDRSVPIAGAMRALGDLVRAGKVRYIGASQFSGWQLARSNALAKMMKWEQFVTIQAHYNLLERDVERELIPLLRVGERRRPAVFSTGGQFAHWKIYARRTASRRIARHVQPVCEEIDSPTRTEQTGCAPLVRRLIRTHTSRPQLLAGCSASSKFRSVIAGATTPEQVSENAKKVEWKLSDEDLAELKKVFGRNMFTTKILSGDDLHLLLNVADDVFDNPVDESRRARISRRLLLSTLGCAAKFANMCFKSRHS